MTSMLEQEPLIVAEAIPPRPPWLVRAALAVASAIHWCFGAISLILGLAVLATFPVLQFLSLGYLLEAAGRISRTGRLREGFVGVRKAAHVGGLVLGTWLLLLPLRFLSDLWHSAYLVDPAGSTTRTLRVVLIAVVHGRRASGTALSRAPVRIERTGPTRCASHPQRAAEMAACRVCVSGSKRSISFLSTA